jgi:hypothetical protein
MSNLEPDERKLLFCEAHDPGDYEPSLGSGDCVICDLEYCRELLKKSLMTIVDLRVRLRRAEQHDQAPPTGS